MRHAYTPSLPELQAFVQAARTGSATRATQALGLTQSAISRALTSLEARLGVALFHRIRQRLIPRLSGFAAIAPQVTFDMTATLGPLDFEHDLRDLAIIRVQPPLRDAAMDVLAEERLVVVAAPALLPGGDMFEDAALAQLPLLQQATRPNLWLDWFLDAGLNPITILRGARFEQFGMVLSAARQGLGLALVPEVFVAPDLASGALRLASARSMASNTPYVLSYPARSLEIAAFRQFRDWLLTTTIAPAQAETTPNTRIRPSARS